MFAYLITSSEYYGNLSECDLRILGQKITRAKARAERLNMELRFAAFRYENSTNNQSLDSVSRLDSMRLDSVRLDSGFVSDIRVDSKGAGVLESSQHLESKNGLLDSKELRAVRYFYEICLDLHITPLLNLSFKPLEILESLALKNLRFGIHLKDSNLRLVKVARENICEPVLYSAHSVERAKEALDFGANFITLSPIFYDKYHKALGVEFLANLDSNLKSHIIALGGINTDSRILKIKESGIAGVAGISYFFNES